jgi:hydroxyethylthiazole kinase-like uncharacterized protein yjeF
VVEAIFEEWPELRATSHRAVVLCGPGNNGGDGFVVARLLKEWGWEVEVFLYGDPGKMPADARVNCERWTTLGPTRPSDQYNPNDWGATDLTCDALFGTGIVRPLQGEAARLSNAMAGGERVVAVDAPSGLCLDSGRLLLDPVEGGPEADLTVTFHAQKVGHLLNNGPSRCGALRIVDIGLNQMKALLLLGDLSDVRSGRHRDLAAVVHALGDEPHAAASYRRQGIPPLSKISDTHKYTHGHALILSGPPGRTGAARLAARGALRIGAGLVTIGAAPEAIPEQTAQVTAVMLRAVADGEALAAVLEDRRINALCLGPGFGTGAREAGLVTVALRRVGNLPTSGAVRGQIAHPTPLVLDADALTLLAQHPGLFAALHESCVLTPHAGEFARLFPDIAEKLAAPATKGPAYSKVDATREAAARAGCVVLYKGPDTVIADPSGRCSINSAHYDRAAPWLATAGSGDVLAGFITGLLARGFAPMQAAETAAWLHVECARKFGPGLIAEDLPEQLPAVFRDLGL